ncbi:MAG: hypothetical protein ACI85V_001860, partial [bacterium]
RQTPRPSTPMAEYMAVERQPALNNQRAAF